MLRREDLGEKIFQLHFAPCAARSDIAEHALEIAHAGREILHFAEAFVNLLQPLTHQTEGLAKARFERGLQFFVNRLAHLFELRRVIGLHGEQALIDHSANGFELSASWRSAAIRRVARSARRTLDAGRDFLAQRPAVLALPLLRAGEIVAQAGFERIVGTKAGQQEQVQNDDRGESAAKNNQKTFL